MCTCTTPMLRLFLWETFLMVPGIGLSSAYQGDFFAMCHTT